MCVSQIALRVIRIEHARNRKIKIKTVLSVPVCSLQQNDAPALPQNGPFYNSRLFVSSFFTAVLYVQKKERQRIQNKPRCHSSRNQWKGRNDQKKPVKCILFNPLHSLSSILQMAAQSGVLTANATFRWHSKVQCPAHENENKRSRKANYSWHPQRKERSLVKQICKRKYTDTRHPKRKENSVYVCVCVRTCLTLFQGRIQKKITKSVEAIFANKRAL